MADEFDIDAFIAGKEQLPEVKPRLTTFYYPETPENTRKAGLSYSMEGGIQGGAGFSDVDLREHTLEKFRAGESDFVAVAMPGKPTGEKFRMPSPTPGGTPIIGKNVDTGGGLRSGQADIATSNPELARTGVERQKGFDIDSFIDDKPQAEIQQIDVHTTDAPDSGGFNINAFIDGTPQPAQTPAPEPQEQRPAVQQAATAPAAAPTLAPVQSQWPDPLQIPEGTAPGLIPTPTQAQLPSVERMPPIGALREGLPPVIEFAQKPLISPQLGTQIAQGVVNSNPVLALNMEALRRLSPEIHTGVTEGAGELVSGASAPMMIASMPAFAVPGVAEAWGAYQLYQTPKHWRGVQDVINRYGLGSKESAKALTGETARLAMAGGALAGRAMMKKASEPVVKPTEAAPPTETGWIDGSGNMVDTGTGVRQSPPQVESRRQIAQGITAKHDSVFTLADYDSRQRVNPLRQEFGWNVSKSVNKNKAAVRDLEAATFIEESQRNIVALKDDAALIKSSKNKKLARKYGPIVDRAIKDFERLSKPNSYQKLMQDQLIEDTAAGITYGEQQGYVTHVLKSEPASSLMSFFTRGGSGGGLSRYFTKHREFDTLAQAIHEGIEPASVNLADLAQHRIAASRRLILQKSLFNELRQISGTDGRTVVAQMGRDTTPIGYDQVHANGVDLAVHPDYAGIFKALYGDSALRRSPTGRAIMRTVGIQKAYTLAADTFHGFRGIQKGLFYGGKGSRLGYNRGTTVYELSDSALDVAVKNGEVSKGQAVWAKQARPAVEAMMREGLNVSRYADNIVEQLHVAFPGTRGLNDWIFKRVFRGAMVQASHANFLRNQSRFPGTNVARRTAREMNEVFGNLMSQGLFKDKTVRDSLNVAFLASQWVESQVRAEFRGYGQAAKVIPDAFRGKFRVGVVAQGQATSIASFLVANQLINYATTGHSTFENPEGHRLAAYIPIGRGIYLDPLALSAEYVSRFLDVMERQGEHATVPGVLTEMARGKLSNIGRSVVTLATQRDWRGRHLEGKELYVGAASELVPLPIAASAAVQRDPSATAGVTVGAEPDRITQQLLQSLGLRAALDRPQIPMRLLQSSKKGIRGSTRGSGIRGSVR